jgi:hypothetical protein
MKKSAFTLSPVTVTDTPAYPSRSRVLALTSGMAATAGLLLSAGCQVALEENPDACDPGETTCQDGATLVQCDRNAVPRIIDCNDYCVTENGPGWISRGCTPGGPDPCMCVYDIIDGEIAMCTPDELYCADDWNVTFCDVPEGETWGTPDTISCHAYCQRTRGTDWTSFNGCDASLGEYLCQCAEDIIDGGIAMCTPDELRCLGDGELAICNDESFFDYYFCGDVCVTELGEGAISLGCDDTDAADPCLCVIPE